jgi:hypothetical protein
VRQASHQIQSGGQDTQTRVAAIGAGLLQDQLRETEVVSTMADKRNVRLTAQQKQLIARLNEGLTIADAGRKAGYSCKQSSHVAYKTLCLRSHDALERAGLSVDQIPVPWKPEEEK